MNTRLGALIIHRMLFGIVNFPNFAFPHADLLVIDGKPNQVVTYNRNVKAMRMHKTKSLIHVACDRPARPQASQEDADDIAAAPIAQLRDRAKDGIELGNKGMV